MKQATCGACEFLFAYESKFAGRKIRCPSCKVPNELPADDAGTNMSAAPKEQNCVGGNIEGRVHAAIILPPIGVGDAYSGQSPGHGTSLPAATFIPPPIPSSTGPLAPKPASKKTRKRKKRKLTRLQEKVLPKVLVVSRFILYNSLWQACFAGMILFVFISMDFDLHNMGPTSSKDALLSIAVIAISAIVLVINFLSMFVSFALRNFQLREWGMGIAFISFLPFFPGLVSIFGLCLVFSLLNDPEVKRAFRS